MHTVLVVKQICSSIRIEHTFDTATKILTLLRLNMHRANNFSCTKTYPTETANERAQVAQKGPYVGSPTFTIFIATLHGHSG